MDNLNAMLTVIENRIPTGLLDAEACQLHEVLPGPTLLHLPGRRQPALFVSVLLHGNESTGLLTIQQLLRRYDSKVLPRALSIFIGNVAAARHGQRRLDDQPDYNRIWPGQGDSPEHAMVAQVMDEMRRRGVFASIDIHNNTGLNPHYACVNRLSAPFLQMAVMFSRTVVYFTKPYGVQSMAFAGLCPAVTLECGQPGQAFGVAHALDYVDACLHLAQLPEHAVAPHDIDLFHSVAVVTVPEQVTFGFGDAAAELDFLEDIDHFNFSELPMGTCFGWARSAQGRLLCRNEHGEDVSDAYFDYSNGRIELARTVMPSMLTLNEQVIRQDCFCYLMERLDCGPSAG